VRDMHQEGSMRSTGHAPNESPGTAAAVSVRRSVNDEIAVRAFCFNGNDGSEFEFGCECGDLSCTDHLRMTLAEYHASEPGSVVSH
jgi:hypothetical protein